MNARWASIGLVVLAAVGVGVALWLALGSQVAGDTVCGPIITQGNRRRSVCDDFYSTRYLAVAIAAGLAAVAYVSSVVVDRLAERRAAREG